ncbi:hypothetical protein [Pedobacter cryotolerans]|uniref:Lipoprotein n=1 Tax=Pedobacter cryotolerans TaxID=2571270 RepID=A0A4U1CC75_9SPHI|nr:hypothetical protein [Pedobacter cryotolerans]TKC01400.1 hypothetical protein FA045_09190 [Pedobacter cryotolerans]
MKKLNTLILICLLFISCSQNPWKGRKVYVLNCKLQGYIASLQEIELSFISETHLEAKETLNSTLGEFRTYKTNPPIGTQSKIFKYSYEGSGDNEILSIDDLKLNLNFTKNGNGELKSNLDETLYNTSIVEIINTEEALERIRQASPSPSLAPMYMKMLKANNKNKINLRESKSVAEKKVEDEEEVPEGFECKQ